eukprot:gene8971-12121_t
MSSKNRKGVHALLLDYGYPLERLVGKDWPADGMPISDTEYMKITELIFVLKNCHVHGDIQLIQSYSKCDSVAILQSTADEKDSNIHSQKKTVVDRESMLQQLDEIEDVLKTISSYCAFRIEINKTAGISIPRIIRLCEKYRFSQGESDLFHLMTVSQGSNNPHVLNTLIEEDCLRRMTAFQRLSAMAEVDIDVFCDPDRQHTKESIVLVDEENNIHYNLRIQRVAVQILYGRK